MKHFILLLIVLSSPIGFSQNLEALDSKYGINKFKLESNVENYSGSLEFISENINKVKSYRYTGNDVSSFYGLPIDDIMLYFYQGKLSSVYFYLSATTPEKEESIMTNLEFLFGREIHAIETDGNIWTFAWTGNKTVLFYGKSDTSNSAFSGRLIISVMSIPIQKKIVEDGF